MYKRQTILDTVDARATEPWLENLAEALGGRKPAYLVVSHMEPDHGANAVSYTHLPESDHFIRMENSRTGDDEGVHWREAAGWFSYRMKTNGKQVNKVRCV